MAGHYSNDRSETLLKKRHAGPIDVHLGQRLKLRRISLGLSQEQLASSSGLTFQQIQKYEKGTNRISASRLYEFSQALSCPVTFFYSDLPSHRATASDYAEQDEVRDRITELLCSHDGVALVEAFSRITQANVRKAIIRLVCDVANGNKSPS